MTRDELGDGGYRSVALFDFMFEGLSGVFFWAGAAAYCGILIAAVANGIYLIPVVEKYPVATMVYLAFCLGGAVTSTAHQIGDWRHGDD